ncbi:hypothetical protein MIMGU_mgv1a0143492mg, partial [Erythranthe guttata]
ILHLPPNSPDAKVFEDLAKNTKKSNVTSPAPGKKINYRVNYRHPLIILIITNTSLRYFFV